MKIQAAEKLRKEYRDFYGRYGLYPASFSDPQNTIFDSENQNLFSGQAVSLLFLNGLLTPEDIDDFNRGLEACKVQSGLYSRYPLHYNVSTRHGISHDEMTGIVIGCISSNNHIIPRQIIEYGHKHNWAFIDENPGTDPFSSVENAKKYSGRIRQPKDRGMYRVAAGQKMSLLEKLSVLAGSFIGTFKGNRHTSGRIMWWNKFQALKSAGVKSKIIDFARNLYDKRNAKVFGNEAWIEDCYAIYFKPDHPFHELVKGLKL